MVGPPPGGKGGYFRLDGVPIVGGTVYVYADSRFAGAPKENDAPPATSDFGPLTTDSAGHWSEGSPVDGYYHASCDYTDPSGQPRRSWQSVLWKTDSTSSSTCIAEGDWTAPTLPACGDATSGVYWDGTSGSRRFGLVGGLNIIYPDDIGPYGSDVNDGLSFQITTHRTASPPYYASAFSMGLSAFTTHFWNISFASQDLDPDTCMNITVDTLFLTGQVAIPAGSGPPGTPSHSYLLDNTFGGGTWTEMYFDHTNNKWYCWNQLTQAWKSVTLT